MDRLKIVGLLLSSALSWCSVQAAAALPDRDAVITIALASRATSLDAPMRLVILEKDPANPRKFLQRDVAVTDIPRYQRPTPLLGENARQFVLRVIQAQENHSKLKAERIAAAVNTALGNGRATVAQTNILARTGSAQWNVVVPGDLAITPIRNGQVTVTGAHAVTYGPSAALIRVRNADIKEARDHNRRNPGKPVPVPKPLTNNHTGEVGDGVRIRNGRPIVPPPGSSRYRGSMGTMNFDLELEFPGEFPGIPMIATGMDDDGNSSIVQFGILDRYVATVHPLPGQTDEELYLILESLLDTHGLPASYDALSRTLTLDEVFGPDDTLFWSNNDTGFSEFLTVSYGVPEPSSLALVAVAIALVCQLSGRRSHRG